MYNEQVLAVLLLLPILSSISVVLLIPRAGRREILKFDFVQFFFAFILVPLGFAWLKTFLYFLVKNEINPTVSPGEMIALDTAFSLIFLYFYAFVVIHSLTKSFELKRQRDPLYDLFSHSESFHIWISHTAIYLSLVILLVMFSLTNIFIPITLVLTKLIFYAVLAMGYIIGLAFFASVWFFAVSTQEKYMRPMRLLFGIGFAIHILAYYFADPRFSASYLVYWLIFCFFGALMAGSLVVWKSERTRSFLLRFHWDPDFRRLTKINKLKRH